MGHHEEMHMNRVLLFVLLALACGVAQASKESHDPFERMNRKIHNSNDYVDRKLMKPIAKGYDRVTPGPVKRVVSNFYGNLADVGDGINNMLQGKPRRAASDIARILINSTIGLGGLFDPASRMGLVDHEEDFAQTLAVWRIPRGPYLVIPFAGPSSVRDVIAGAVDSRLNPLRYYRPVGHRNAIYAFELLHSRSELLAAESVVFGDKYIFYRDAWLQRREYLEKDGEVEDLFEDDF